MQGSIARSIAFNGGPGYCDSNHPGDFGRPQAAPTGRWLRGVKNWGENRPLDFFLPFPGGPPDDAGPLAARGADVDRHERGAVRGQCGGKAADQGALCRGQKVVNKTLNPQLIRVRCARSVCYRSPKNPNKTSKKTQ